MVKKIKLTQGKSALVDDEDFDYLNQWKWHVDSNGYAVHSKHCYLGYKKYKNTCIYLHRAVLKAQAGQMIDHKDGNRLNNQKQNLRFCSPSQNVANKKNQKNKITSIYRGVDYNPRFRKKWRTRIQKDRYQIEIGRFDNEYNAALAYNNKARELFGEFARINNVK